MIGDRFGTVKACTDRVSVNVEDRSGDDRHVPRRGLPPLTRNVDSPPWCFVAAATASKEDSIIGDAPQIVVTAEGAECFVHPHGERPQGHTDLELVTVQYQPWMNVNQHSHFPEHSTPAVSETTGICSP